MMWKKILLALVLKVLEAINWDALLLALLQRLEAEVESQTGVEVNLAGLDRKRLWGAIEETVSDHLGIAIDLNDDGVVGDGKDG